MGGLSSVFMITQLLGLDELGSIEMKVHTAEGSSNTLRWSGAAYLFKSFPCLIFIEALLDCLLRC